MSIPGRGNSEKVKSAEAQWEIGKEQEMTWKGRQYLVISFSGSRITQRQWTVSSDILYICSVSSIQLCRGGNLSFAISDWQT